MIKLYIKTFDLLLLLLEPKSKFSFCYNKVQSFCWPHGGTGGEQALKMSAVVLSHPGHLNGSSRMAWSVEDITPLIQDASQF